MSSPRLYFQFTSTVVWLACAFVALSNPVFAKDPAAEELGAGGRIAGRVTAAATGAGLANIQLHIYDSSGEFTASAFTATEGDYLSPTLVSGTYYVRTINSPGYIDELFNNIPCVPSCDVTTGTPVIVTTGEVAATTGNINFALATGGGVAGRVTDAQTAAALADVSVSIYDAMGEWMTTTITDASGNYQTTTGLPSGTYFATTTNSQGYADELYNNLPCTGNACDPTTGTPIAVSAASGPNAVTTGIDFALARQAAFVVAGLTGMANNGGWLTLRRDLDQGRALETWLRLPWANYNNKGGGVHAAAGDVDGDGLDEIVLGLGPGGNGWMAVLDDGQHGYALLGWIQVPWTNYNERNGEVYPAVGDLDGDGLAEIVAGLGSGAAGWFAIFNCFCEGFGFRSWERVDWDEYNAGADGSTHPAVADLDDNGAHDIVLGLGAGSQGKLEIRYNGAGSASFWSEWIQVSWPEYNAQNGTTYPAAHSGLIVVGLGHGGQGKLERFRPNLASSDFSSAGWLQISWPNYNNSVGDTHPALGYLGGDMNAALVVGLAPIALSGGWFEVINPSSGSSLGWTYIQWDAFNSSGGGMWPAIGKVK